MTNVELQFGGGAETLFKNEKSIKISLPGNESWTMKKLLEWIKENLLKDCKTPELLIQDGTVRPGILVLINDCDWEIMDGINAVINNNDTITFLSTLHGG
uniref:Ubiquitin-related modifier 1 homolog n=1 Tax=Parastrongyloides trichosuri TaxID=131310 RepID=A0A0N4Z4S4_PARTI